METDRTYSLQLLGARARTGGEEPIVSEVSDVLVATPRVGSGSCTPSALVDENSLHRADGVGAAKLNIMAPTTQLCYG